MAKRFTLKKRQQQAAEWDKIQDLNAEQQAVVLCPSGPMLVVAGAGSGKTRALTYRLAYLLHCGVPPQQMLLVTFTNRAAKEMQERIGQLVHGAEQGMWAGTFHSIANRLLRRDGAAIGLSPNFGILDSEDSKELLGRCMADMDLGKLGKRFPKKNVLATMISLATNRQQSLSSIISEDYPQFDEMADLIAQVAVAYAERKQQRQLCDYDDLLTKARDLLNQDPDIRSQYNDRFTHILVDEYQDTNLVQADLIDLLSESKRNICVVGDDAQSIYSFRGAFHGNMLAFADRFGSDDKPVQQFKLEANYRSVPQVLDFANASIAHNQARLPKELRAVKGSGELPTLVPCQDGYEQAEFIAQYIVALHNDDGHELKDIAVLYRSHWHSMEIQLALQRAGIPFQVRGGIRFFEQAHIKDVLAYLRLAEQSTDELAWFRLVRYIPRVGEATARKLWLCFSQHGQLSRLNDKDLVSLVPAAGREEWHGFAELMTDIAGGLTAADAIARIGAGPYREYLMSTYDNFAGRLEDLEGLAQFAQGYESIAQFLAEVALNGDMSGERQGGSVDQPDDCMVCSTIHQAKGLEWPIVFIPWLADGRFPSDYSQAGAELEEERRVFHVAVTRAQQDLLLVVPRMYEPRGGGVVFMKPSRFISEVDPALYQFLHLDEE